MASKCGGCEVDFGGFNTCHCSRCHETFSGITLFDKHQSGSKCLAPTRMKDSEGRPLVRTDPDRPGVWVGADEKDWAEIFGRKTA